MGLHSEGKSPAIQQLTPRHRSMVRTQVAGGLTPMDLSRYYGLTPGQISRIVNSPAYIAEMNRLEASAEANSTEVATKVAELRDLALRNLTEDLLIDVEGDTERRKIRQKANEVALAMARLTGKDSIQIKNTTNILQQNVGNMSKEDLQKDVFDIIGSE